MPESLAMAQRYLMTVTPTLDGNFVDDFGRAPSPIQLQGTFGKKLRAVVGPGLNNSSITGSVLNSLRSTTSSTGYGMVKALSEIVDRSHTPNAAGLMPKTVLFNWAFDSHWEVVINGFDVSQSVQQNGIWFYSMGITCLRPWGGSGNFHTDEIISSVLGSVLNNTAGRQIAQAVQVVNTINTAKTWVKSARKALGG
jgi:hypothetical protein